MLSRATFRSPYAVLVVFMAVALVSAGALGWLVWQLVRQDAQVEAQRRRERLEQAADRSAATMQRLLLDFQALARPESAPGDEIPDGVSVVSIDASGVVVRPAGSVPYLPRSRPAAEARAGLFAEGERLEAPGEKPDVKRALQIYAPLADAADRAVSAAALVRIARVHRKLGDSAAALAAYDRLGAIPGVAVHGLPSGLIARVGRATIYEGSGDATALREEGAALRNDLTSGAWPLVRSEYEYYLNEAHRWVGSVLADDLDARARAEGLDWVWRNRSSLERSSRRVLALKEAPALVAWTAVNGDLRLAVAGASYLAGVSTAAVPPGFVATLTDQDGALLVGPPPSVRDAVRTGPAAGLPWTLHVSAVPGQEDVASTWRRELLLLVFGTVALIMLGGGYFILRAIAGELRVARLQSDFVAAVSHEFRSPLTSLYQIAQMLASDRFPSEEARRRSYDVLVSETERLRGLVEGLLDFGRFDRGAEFRFERVDLAALVRGTVADFQERVAREGYAIELFGGSGPLYLQADREALSRAVWNLLDNAVKYSPECRTVWVDLASDDRSIRVSVRDQGLGIPAGEQPQIFDRFVRGSESKARRIRGTGIGLAMVRQIVRAHGGEIQLTSAPGRGSSFTIELRRAEQTQQRAGDATQAAAAPNLHAPSG